MSFEIHWNERVPLRDGARLDATIYLPLIEGAASPAILSMTPYNADTYHDKGRYFAEAGFAFVLVDVRGRGSSDGEFEPFVNERLDGFDVVEWIAIQPWCDGKVAMWGGSYAGMDQWYTAASAPPHLATIVPAAPSWVGLELPFQGGIYNTWCIQWLTLTSGKTVRWNAMADAAYWTDLFRRFYRTHVPFAQLASFAHNAKTKFETWLSHPTLDAYWKAVQPTPADLQRVTIPVLSITGLFDGATIGTFAFFRKHVEVATNTNEHYLIVGPWDHAGTRDPKSAFGGLTFGPQSLLDMNRLHVQWYTYTMLSGRRPDFLRDRICYYVTGLEEWRFAPTLEAMTVRREVFYLTLNGVGGHDVFDSGRLLSNGSSEPGTFTYDPLDTRPGEMQKIARRDVLLDQTSAFNLFGNGLIYHSEPLTQDIVLVGEPKVVLFVSVDVLDTDLSVSLYEIAPDGKAITMWGDRIRARYRKSLDEPSLLNPGEIYEYRFENIKFVSRLCKKGARIRLVVSCPNSIFEQKNYNSGGDPRYESAADAKTAHVTVYHASPHASYVELPFGESVSKHVLKANHLAEMFMNSAEAVKNVG